MLTLVETVKAEKTAPILAVTEGMAARMVGMGRDKFRDLVDSGVIPFLYHANGIRRIYLAEDLREYLGSRERFKIIDGNPLPLEKGKTR